jgi:hypothetical protein
MDRIDTDATLAEANSSPEPKYDDQDGPSKACIKTTSEEYRRTMWVGYVHQDSFFIDTCKSSGTTEETLKSIHAWWELRIPRLQRTVYGKLLCTRPIVMVGLLPQVCNTSHHEIDRAEFF